MMHVDHNIYLPILARVTLPRYSFADGAEIFVFISGLGCGLSYGPVVARQGLLAAIKKSMSRMRYLYLVHAVIALLWLSTLEPLRHIAVSPLQHLGSILIFREYSGATLLPLYLIFMAFMPWAVCCWQRRPYVLIALSTITYFAGQYIPSSGRVFWFNPLCWQAVFVLGLVLGIQKRKGRLWRPAPGVWRAAAAGLVVIAVARLLQSQWLAALLSQPFLKELAYPFTNKGYEGGLRILNLVLWLLVVPKLLTRARLDRFRIGNLFAMAGRYPLSVYTTSLLAELVLRMPVIAALPAIARGLVWECSAIALLGAGWAIYRVRQADVHSYVAAAGPAPTPVVIHKDAVV
jgi:hypothetical protein